MRWLRYCRNGAALTGPQKFRYTRAILGRLRRGTQVVRERSAKPLCVGSIPTRASNFALCFHSVHRPLPKSVPDLYRNFSFSKPDRVSKPSRHQPQAALGGSVPRGCNASKRNAEAMGNGTALTLCDSCQTEKFLEALLPQSGDTFSPRLPAPRVKRDARPVEWLRAPSAPNPAKRYTQARQPFVEEKPLSIDPVGRERHCIGNAHTAVAHEDYQAFQPKRIKLAHDCRLGLQSVAGGKNQLICGRFARLTRDSRSEAGKLWCHNPRTPAVSPTDHRETERARVTFELRAVSYPAHTAHHRLKPMKHDLTLNHVKKEARDLRRGLQRRDPEALRRCKAIDPFAGPPGN